MTDLIRLTVTVVDPAARLTMTVPARPARLAVAAPDRPARLGVAVADPPWPVADFRYPWNSGLIPALLEANDL